MPDRDTRLLCLWLPITTRPPLTGVIKIIGVSDVRFLADLATWFLALYNSLLDYGFFECL